MLKNLFRNLKEALGNDFPLLHSILPKGHRLLIRPNHRNIYHKRIILLPFLFFSKLDCLLLLNQLLHRVDLLLRYIIGRARIRNPIIPFGEPSEESAGHRTGELFHGKVSLITHSGQAFVDLAVVVLDLWFGFEGEEQLVSGELAETAVELYFLFHYDGQKLLVFLFVQVHLGLEVGALHLVIYVGLCEQSI